MVTNLSVYPNCLCLCSFCFRGKYFNCWIWNNIGRNCLLGHRIRIAKFLMRTFICRSTFLYAFNLTFDSRKPANHAASYWCFQCFIWVHSTEIDTLEQQQTEKIETEMKDVDDSIGYESWKCTQAVQGGILGGHKSSPVRHKFMLSPCRLQLPT